MFRGHPRVTTLLTEPVYIRVGSGHTSRRYLILLQFSSRMCERAHTLLLNMQNTPAQHLHRDYTKLFRDIQPA